MLIMLFLGIVMTLVGFIIVYKRAFAVTLEAFNSIFFFIAYIVAMSFDKPLLTVVTFVVCLIIDLLVQQDFKSLFSISKFSYIVFNIKTDKLLGALSEILNKNNISNQIVDNTILLHYQNDRIIKVKPSIFNLNILNLFEISNTELFKIVDIEMESVLRQAAHRKLPFLGTSFFIIGLISVILFYSSIL